MGYAIKKIDSPFSASSNVAIDPMVAQAWQVTFHGNTMGIAIAKAPNTGQTYDLYLLLLDDGAARTITWSSNVHFSGSAPAPAVAGTFVHLVSYDGSAWFQD